MYNKKKRNENYKIKKNETNAVDEVEVLEVVVL
jgi:hypothetical protein